MDPRSCACRSVAQALRALGQSLWLLGFWVVALWAAGGFRFKNPLGGDRTALEKCLGAVPALLAASGTTHYALNTVKDDAAKKGFGDL